MITSSNGNIFRVTGHLCGQFTGFLDWLGVCTRDPDQWRQDGLRAKCGCQLPYQFILKIVPFDNLNYMLKLNLDFVEHICHFVYVCTNYRTSKLILIYPCTSYITIQYTASAILIFSPEHDTKGHQANDWRANHYNDVIMNAMASQITSLTIVYSIVYSRCRSKKTSKFRVTGLCAGNPPMTGEFPAQMVSNAENVSISWRYYDKRTIFNATAPHRRRGQWDLTKNACKLGHWS